MPLPSRIDPASVVDEKHLNFIGIEKKLTNLLKELKASETISEIDYKKLQLRSSSFGNVCHLDLFHQQLKLPLII